MKVTHEIFEYDENTKFLIVSYQEPKDRYNLKHYLIFNSEFKQIGHSACTTDFVVGWEQGYIYENTEMKILKPKNLSDKYLIIKKTCFSGDTRIWVDFTAIDFDGNELENIRMQRDKNEIQVAYMERDYRTKIRQVHPLVRKTEQE